MKIDLHVHSIHSRDGLHSVHQMADYAKKKGLGGIAVCEHDRLIGDQGVDDFFVLYGEEVSTKQGHLCVFGAGREFKRGSDAFEVCELAKEEDALIIAPHPFSPRKSALRGVALKLDVDALERFNGFDVISNLVTIDREIKGTGGSDAHSMYEVGNAFTVIDCEPSEDELFSAVKKGKYHAIWSSSFLSIAKRYAGRVEKLLDQIEVEYDFKRHSIPRLLEQELQ